MRVGFVHNPNAGQRKRPAGDALLDLIRDAGHDIVWQAAKDDPLQAMLAEKPDLVAIAGGDGTVARVVPELLGCGIPLAILPTGTANNIARTLGIARIGLARQIAAWPAWRATAFDIGLARGPWGSRHFVESVGVGLLATGILRADASAMLEHLDGTAEKHAYVRRMLADGLKAATPVRCKASLDQDDISGDYLLFEAMNVRSVGPNLLLAPDADAGDGLLDIVAISRAHRSALHGRVGTRGVRSRRVDLPIRRGRTLRLEWREFDLHFDDDVWPDGNPVDSGSKTIEVTLEEEKVEILVPPR